MEEHDRAWSAAGRAGLFARFGGIASGLGSAACLVFLPKCPLCAAALLSAAGLGASSAWLVAPLLRPVALVLALGAFLGCVWLSTRAVGPRACCRQKPDRERCPTRADCRPAGPG